MAGDMERFVIILDRDKDDPEYYRYVTQDSSLEAARLRTHFTPGVVWEDPKDAYTADWKENKPLRDDQEGNEYTGAIYLLKPK